MSETGSGFDSRGLGLKAQKKFLSKMSSRKVVTLIDDTTGRVLDSVYRMAKEHTGSKKDAEKLVKNIIKIVVKLGILYRNDQFNAQELALAQQLQSKFHNLMMTIMSFYEVDFTFDKQYLIKSLDECCTMIKSLIKRHLTEKSQGRVESVFAFFSNPEFLDAVFIEKGPLSVSFSKISDDLHSMLDNGSV